MLKVENEKLKERLMIIEKSTTPKDDQELNTTPPEGKQNNKRIPSLSTLTRRVKARTAECTRKAMEISPQIGTDDLEKLNEERKQCKKLRWDKSYPAV